MKSSTHMEYKGLVKTLKLMTDNSVQVETLITDQHNQTVLTIVMMCGMCQKVHVHISIIYCV